MLSNIVLGTQVIPFDVERYDPDKFQTVTRDQISIVKKPDEVPPLHLAHEMVKYHIMNSGSYSLSPFSFNWNQHSQIYTIISIFKKFSNSIVLSSCRVDAIARDPGLAQLINQFGAQNLTVAVEGISEKVCNFLQKSLMPEEFYVGMNTIIHQNFASVKMYYIYTGLEGEEDIEEFEGHLRRIDEIRRKAGKPTFEMRMSFTPLLSTLGTPLQYHGSKVSRSLKTGSVALFKIKHICARYGFGIRLSSSIASSDFAQTVEFLDRRGQPLLEYLSLNGAFAFPKLNLLFYRDAEEISKEVHDRLVAANRTKIGDKYYRVKPIDRITVNKLYALVNAESLFPEHSIYALIESLRKLHGQEVPAEILKAFPKRRREHLIGTFVKVAEDEGEDFVTDFGNGKKAYHMLINVTVNDIAADIIKSWIPLFTNGVTFNDVTDDKDALYIFPSMHIKFHRNRHIGQDFKQYVANRAYIFDSYCFNDALSKCVNCGACDTVAEVKHVTTTPYKETGENSMHKLLAVQRDNEIFQKLLIEVRIKPGPYAALQPRWLRFAITRAILKASNGELVEPNVQERFSHSRQFYRIHQDSFKSILSGSFIAELSFNSLVNIDEAYLKRLQDNVNKYVTEGWYVSNISRKSKDFLIKNSMQYAMTTYRFDSRKVNGIDLDLLKKQIDVFFNSNAVITYKSQQQSGRDTTRVVAKDFDKAKVLYMSAGIGRNRYETVLKVISKVEDNHPLIFLAGMLGATPDGKGKPKSYTALYGTEVSIDGFYQYSSTHGGSNLFDLFSDETDGSHEHSTACPKCGDPKLINITTGLPFGEAEYEQDPIIMQKYGKVCQSCFAEMTP